MKLNKVLATAMVTGVLATSFIGGNIAEASHKMDTVGNRYELAADFMAGKGYQGDSAIHFGVTKKVTRADAAEMLAKALELDYENAPDSGFTDVSPEDAPYVNALKEAGITNGKTATTFGSDEILTRGQIAIWLTEGYGLKGDVDVPFKDVSSRYHDAVSAMAEHGITNGTTATTFGTWDQTKRGDFAIFLHRADEVEKVDRPREEEEFGYNDVHYGTVGEDGIINGPGSL